MNLTDVIGPVMVGPSSSHTAGVVRIGKVARSIFGGTPKELEIIFYRSFAKTYKGHGSDKAIVAGLLGFEPDDVRIRNSVEYAIKEGYEFNINPSDRHTTHPNTVRLKGYDKSGQWCEVTAESIGGGEIRIRKINQVDVELDGSYDTIITRHRDKPGVVSKLSKILYDADINIATMKVYRDSKGEQAIMLIEVDSRPDVGVINQMSEVDGLDDVKFISKIF
ncbi:MAG: L-serine ammonia-lyase, iron-sulfur-dependent subunit beta [Lachnospirales bacterium]